MPNLLAHETSPYLLQHAHQPVHWQPWGEQALQQAVLEDKPIFLSIGYSACHWCHVMAHESFDDPRTASLLNQNFISIKLDREERPDLDNIYMTAVVAMTGQGGWPLSVFLTPDGRPFFGGTYFPPEPRYNMPAFTDLLIAIARMWQDNRIEFLRNADELYQHLQSTVLLQNPDPAGLPPAFLSHATERLLAQYDRKNGGWGSAPKFPAPMSIDFLLGRAERGETSAGQTAAHALRAMQRGGIWDGIGGGFHRYSTDAGWLVPHFEKMLYDNVQLAHSYLHAYRQTGDESFKDTAEKTLDFILRELHHPAGGFYSSLDADSEGEEGKFYLWSYAGLKDTLEPPEFAHLAQLFPLTEDGNFEGKIILQQSIDPAQPTGVKAIPQPNLFETIRSKLFAARAGRVRPATDDKILTFWNALAISAFAEAGRILDRDDYRQAARDSAQFIHANLMPDGQLRRSWRAGTARHAAGLEDYAALGLALLALYQMDLNPQWYRQALECFETLQREFKDPRGGFFSVRSGQKDVIIRMKEAQDQAMPSGNALAALLLVKLAYLMEREDLLHEAEQMVSAMQEEILRYPNAFGVWLQVSDWLLNPVEQIVAIWDATDLPQEILRAAAQESCRLFTLFSGASAASRQEQPRMTHQHPIKFHPATFYVCRGKICSAPAAALAEARAGVKTLPG